MTNYEVVKAMGMNELAGFLASLTTCCNCPVYRNCDGHVVCTAALLEWLSDDDTILFNGKEIDVDDEPGETSDMVHHPGHYTWKGTECKKVIEIMTRGLSGAEAYYMGNIIKYLYRYPKKGTLLSDLAKAEEYTKFLRELFMEDGGKA